MSEPSDVITTTYKYDHLGRVIEKTESNPFEVNQFWENGKRIPRVIEKTESNPFEDTESVHEWLNQRSIHIQKPIDEIIQMAVQTAIAPLRDEITELKRRLAQLEGDGK